jgi:DNA-binding transcriptional LysR family regulator
MARLKNLLNAETLCWISRMGTFRAAAEQLYTTQPAVSARMRDLEQALGVPLFERRGRRLELTLAARRFVERVEPLLVAVEDAFTDVDALADSAGTIRLGLGEITMTWFSGIVPELRRTLPRISYEIEMDLAFKLKQNLKMGKLDLAIVAGPLDDDRLVWESIGTTKMVWMVSSALLHDENGCRRPAEELLRTVPLWCVSRPSEFSASALRALRKIGANLDNICTCNHLVGLIDLVERGAGIGQIPEIMIADRIATGKLVPLTPELDTTTLEFNIACHRDQEQPVIRHIMKTAIELSHYAPMKASKRTR